MNPRNKKGMIILVISYMVIVILLILGIAFYYRNLSDSKIAGRQNNAVQVTAIAEAGVNRAIYDLRQDFLNGGDEPSWIDGNINGIVCGPDANNFYTLHDTTTLGNGTYKVELKNVMLGGAARDNEIWVRSTGTSGEITKTIYAYLKVRNYCIWNNALFGGTGFMHDRVVNGNANISGSVHIMATKIDSDEYGIRLSNNGGIYNNYEGIPAEFSSRIPNAPMTTVGGEDVQTLNAEFRLKNGLAGLDGDSTIGDPDQSGNGYKETLDGAFDTYGYGGGHGADSVYSDNGTQHGYDLGDLVDCPMINEYQTYLRDNALVITDPAQLNQLDSIRPDSLFNYSGPKGSIRIDGHGNMTISGIVYIDGGRLRMLPHAGDTTITYRGRGSIFASKNVVISVNLLTPATGTTFPEDIIGIMTPKIVNFSADDIKVMGMFYSENESHVNNSGVQIAGTLVSNYFAFSRMPKIYQIPEAVKRLPPGLIGSTPVWVVRVVFWKEGELGS